MQNFLIKLLEPKTNGPEMAEVLTSLLNVKVTATTLTKEIEEHPNYPSLLSISDVLTTYGVENIGIKFDINKTASLPVPFVTQLQSETSNIIFFTIVKQVKDHSIILYDPEKHSWAEFSTAEFKDRCSRIALLVEAVEGAGESDYKTKRREERKRDGRNYTKILTIPAIVVIGVVISLVNSGLDALFPAVYSVLTLSGAAVATLLLFYELDMHNPLLRQICSSGKKVNCGTVLRSKGSKIFGISWSSIGFSYFTGILLLLLFSGINNPVNLYVVSLLTSVSVFYVLFSVYYQWRIAQQWCVLCLSVQAILILQFFVVIIGGWYQFSGLEVALSQSILPLLCSFSIPFILLLVLLPALQKSKESKSNYTELQKLKHNRQVFETLLLKQKNLAENPDDLGIFLGNENARHKLIKVCNPYCTPCSEAHKPMEKLLENNSDVRIQILFTASNKEGDTKAPPVKHLLAIAEKSNEAVVKKALDDWYLSRPKDYDAFAAKYPMNDELKNQGDKIEAMKNWCDKAVIPFTPMFFVSFQNQHNETSYYQLPEVYNVSDLKYFFSV